jgi:hypothetical protein
MIESRSYIPQIVFTLLAAIQLTGPIYLHGADVAVAEMEPTLSRPPDPEIRVQQTSMGITQLPNDKLDWLLDVKFGIFVHWGLYSGVGRGEWVMQNEGISPETHRPYAYPESGDVYFDAADYHPEAWAQLAKDAGMKWMCLTTRHHDGFWLFDSLYSDAFTRVPTLHRDVVEEYVKACRAAGLRVGIYYSLLSWRYPDYCDVTGTNCSQNRFGYKTDPAHLENARLTSNSKTINQMTRTSLRQFEASPIIEEEGPPETTGRIRNREICDKNLTIQDGRWGYNGKFKMQPLGKLYAKKAYAVYTGKTLSFKGDSRITIHDIDRTHSPSDSIVAVVYNDEIRHVWSN